MPVGRKTIPETEAVIDFDRVFDELVAPAIEAAGLAIRSWRSGNAGASIQKEALGDIITADVFLADVTTANPNVMYELGVRHAANRGPTLLLRGSPAPTPFYAGFLQAVLYDPEADLDQPEALRARLSRALRAEARRAEGSPVYEFFPGLRVELPAELRERGAARAYPKQLQQAIEAAGSRESRVRRGDAKAVEELIGASGDVSPTAYLDLLRLHRDAGDWDELIRTYDTLPPDVASDPQVLQLLALALNRRARQGDQERAVAVMRQLVEESGGDAETFAILGRIYKDRWREGADASHLDAAIECYRRGFELQPSDLYSGFNAASLMFLRGDSPHEGDLAALVLQVKQLVREQGTPDDPWVDYWVISIGLELAVIEGDWTLAEQYLAGVLEKRPDALSRRASVESLQQLQQRLRGEDAEAVGRLLDRLQPDAAPETGDYA
jgi:tetratricopeptide (TPR) repeat protein